MDIQTLLMIGLGIVGAYLAIPWEQIRKFFPKLPEKEPEQVAELKKLIDKLTGGATTVVTKDGDPAADELAMVNVHVCALIKVAQARGDQAMVDNLNAFWSAYIRVPEVPKA